MQYVFVEPERFTDAHRRYIEQFSRSVEVVSSFSDAIAGAKDLHSRYLTASDSYARLVGMSFGKDLVGRMDSDIPREDISRFADSCVRQDRSLIARNQVGAVQTVLDIHRYGTGPKALVFDRCFLKHHPSKSVLGLAFTAHEITIERFTTLFPGYWKQFGFGCSIERVEHPSVDGLGKLCQLEHEVAFLLAIGLDVESISNLLPRLRPGPSGDVDAALFGLADKAAAAGVPMAGLRNCLIGAFVHQRMPKSFFAKVVGMPA